MDGYLCFAAIICGLLLTAFDWAGGRADGCGRARGLWLAGRTAVLWKLPRMLVAAAGVSSCWRMLAPGPFWCRAKFLVAPAPVRCGRPADDASRLTRRRPVVVLYSLVGGS
jgi:hypothetical protein